MSKNYLPDIKVIRKPFAFVKRVVLILLVLSLVLGTFMLADVCSNALTFSAVGLGLKNNERVNVEKYSLFAIVMATYDNKQDAEKVALGLQVQGAAGYIWQSNNKHLVLGSIYDEKEKADTVINNMGKTNYNPQVFEIKFSKLSLVIKGISKEDNVLITDSFNFLKKIYSEIYAYSVNYDSSISSNLAISSSLNTIKSETKVNISKLQELSARVDSHYINHIKDTFILIDSSIDTAVYRTLTDSGINYYLKYLMCEIVELSYKLNLSLLKSK